MLSAKLLSFVLGAAVVPSGVFGTPAAPNPAGKDVGYCTCSSCVLSYPFVRTSFGRVVMVSGSGALFRGCTAPTLRSLWITMTVPPGPQTLR